MTGRYFSLATGYNVKKKENDTFVKFERCQTSIENPSFRLIGPGLESTMKQINFILDQLSKNEVCYKIRRLFKSRNVVAIKINSLKSYKAANKTHSFQMPYILFKQEQNKSIKHRSQIIINYPFKIFPFISVGNFNNCSFYFTTNIITPLAKIASTFRTFRIKL